MHTINIVTVISVTGQGAGRRVSGNMSRDGSRVGNDLMEGELDRFWHAQAEATAPEAVGFQCSRPGQDGVPGAAVRSR